MGSGEVMNKRRQQMHGKTFGGIKWSHRPENHNRFMRVHKDLQALQKRFGVLSSAAQRAAAAMIAFGIRVSAIEGERP